MESSKTLKVGSHKKNISKKNKVKLWDEFDIQEQTPQNAVSIKKICSPTKSHKIIPLKSNKNQGLPLHRKMK